MVKRRRRVKRAAKKTNAARKQAKRRASRSRPARNGKRRLAALPEAQRYLPAGFHRKGGHVATLAQVADPRTPTVDGEKLTPEQQKQLTLARIALQRDVQFGTLDGGVVDKERALREVQAETPLGKTLIEIERRTIEMVREYAKRGTVAPKTKPGKRRKRRTARRTKRR